MQLYEVVYVREHNSAPHLSLTIRHALPLELAYQVGKGIADALCLKSGMAVIGDICESLDGRLAKHGLEQGASYNWLTVMPTDDDEHVYVRPNARQG